MPPVSEAQRRAMRAAAEGRSTLGIPKSVGKEFVGKDGAPLAAGIVFVAPDGEVLLLRRSGEEENYAGHWALPGGKADDGETAEEAALREAREECGVDASIAPMCLMDRAETPNGMIFSTFACPVGKKFTPKLNDEHSGYAWASLDALPRPIHPSVARVLGEHLGVSGDMKPEDWDALRSTFAKWTREEEQEGEHAEDWKVADNMPKLRYAPGMRKFLDEQANDDGTEGNARGKLNEKQEAEASRTTKEREEMPAHAFLEGEKRKYPVKEKKDGEWVYSRNLLLAAARRARMAGHQDLAQRADAIRKREFDGAEDQWNESDHPRNEDGTFSSVNEADAIENFARSAGLNVRRSGSNLSDSQYLYINHPDDEDNERNARIRVSNHVAKPTYEKLNGIPDYEVGWHDMANGAEAAEAIAFLANRYGIDIPQSVKARLQDIANQKQKREQFRLQQEKENSLAFLKSAEQKKQAVKNIQKSPEAAHALTELEKKLADPAITGNARKKLKQRQRDLLSKYAGAKDERIAFDRKSVRTFDTDGHMHVARTPISKANVCEYYGYEIPDADKLGLDPQRRYKLLRHPDELAKAAASSNGKPLLIKHVPTSADDHQTDAVVGAVGTDAKFEHPYLYNSLSVWDGDAIEGIKDETQKELSSAYRYRADMTPGTYEGVPYDGVMRDIEFNHVALVPEGRAGADVVVGDSKPKGNILMSKTVLTRKGTLLAGAVAAYLMPKLAQDAKFDVNAVFSGVTEKNFPKKKAKIAEFIRRTAKIAQDADLQDLDDLLDRLEEHKVAEGADIDPSSGLPMSAEEMERKKAADEEAEREKKAADAKRARDEKLSAFKASHNLDEATCKALDELMGDLDGMDEEDEEAVRNAEGEDRKGAKDTTEPTVSKAAMDAAIQRVKEETARETLKTANQIAEAKDFASKWVGRLAMDAVSPADVYKAALDHLGVDTAGIHPSAYRKLLELHPLPGATSRSMAQDAAPDVSGFNARFGDIANRISIAG